MRKANLQMSESVITQNIRRMKQSFFLAILPLNYNFISLTKYIFVVLSDFYGDYILMNYFIYRHPCKLPYDYQKHCV